MSGHVYPRLSPTIYGGVRVVYSLEFVTFDGSAPASQTNGAGGQEW